MATMTTNMPTENNFLARVWGSLLPRTTLTPALAVQDLSDAELDARGMKRTDIAREIMVNGSWS